MNHLLSVVFILHYPAMIPYGEFSGRRAQRLFFDVLRKTNRALVDTSHDENSPLVYSISSLIYTGDDTYWMRVATTEPRLVIALENICNLALPRTFHQTGTNKQWTLLAVQRDGHEWAGHAQLNHLIDHTWDNPPPPEILLDVHTPTSVRSLGLYRPHPDPVLLFRSLFDRWRHAGLSVPQFTPDPALWDIYTQYHLSLLDAKRLALHMIDHKKGESIPAFTGILHIKRHRHNAALWQTARRNHDRYDTALLEQAERIRARHDDLARWVHLLAQLAFYSGVGIKTGWGMGMVRPLDSDTP